MDSFNRPDEVIDLIGQKVTVSTRNGNSIEGTLIGVKPNSISVKVDNETRVIANRIINSISK